VRIYEPRGEGPFPLLLDVHAGIWNFENRLSSESIDRPIAASGIVVAAIDYRLAPQYSYPSSVADVNFATRWVKIHARDFNADPGTLGALGSSAGAHLLMLSALRPRDPRYAAIPLTAAPHVDATVGHIIALSPILDPYARYVFAQQTGRTELVKYHNNYFHTVEAMQEGNPQRILSSGLEAALPPTLIIQGTRDASVTVEMQERFARAYRAAGGTAELEIFANMPHLFVEEPGPATKRAFELIKGFSSRSIAGRFRQANHPENRSRVRL
jgi:acetyl esterase